MSPLHVAVIGATGTVGSGLVPALEADDRVGRIVSVGRRAVDPAEHGWTRTEHRLADVRDPEALRAAVDGADVVVHLAFVTTGVGTREGILEVNVEGTVNAVHAAKDAGATRFVWASSVAAYGFHRDNPVPLTEDWPTRPSPHFFYARDKAELEDRLTAEADGLELFLVRPAVVLGENPVGAKVPGRAAAVGNALVRSIGRSPVPLPVPVPDLPFQVVHHDDLGRALAACVAGDGAPGAYNVAADGELTAGDVARQLGLRGVPFPTRLIADAARAVAAAPGLPPAVEWAEALAHPALMDTGKAKRELGWAPRHDAADTLRITLGR